LTVFQFLFAIGSRRYGGAPQLGDRGHRELSGPAKVMRVKDAEYLVITYVACPAILLLETTGGPDVPPLTGTA
jgi:hypothetical protein